MKIIFEYIWLGGNNEFRSKIRVIDLQDYNFQLSDLPIWNFDGSSTNQTITEETEIVLKPIKYVLSPFLNNSYLVLCECYNNDNTPTFNNYRYEANLLFEQKKESEPWFGLEQEYFILSNSYQNNVTSQGPYYCGIGNGKYSIERDIAHEHLENCIKAGINISGINAEVAHCQWEFQIGPCTGIDASDQLLLARYILERIAEKYSVKINYLPKPFSKINGSGCHINFSTNDMRNENGLESIKKAIQKLGKYHQEIIQISGESNQKRLTGTHETSSIDVFSYGIGTRHTSVRIPYSTYNDKKGYFEDRRYGANVNPYIATSMLYKIICL
jgi:glutamine synthetase